MHVSTVAVVTGAGGHLWIIVVRGDGRLRGRWSQVAGSVVLGGHVWSWSHSRSVSSTVLMEGHGCRQTPQGNRILTSH